MPLPFGGSNLEAPSLIHDDASQDEAGWLATRMSMTAPGRHDVMDMASGPRARSECR
ncbi:hypothetical protein L861_23505 [Litchfieldella anticariensis FP35 = DSM 16096]|uniref:Uncharacterized protein n=1 Tax=Litchfieldella anticariensis (strain DSM 16096 / CECT 5854 / CIP 108499 / LMG 22089 / FP35) TaxID=1121939 RepID=S2KQM5_LITA3|nr:hypothetical protein L861_23505 [Halomonas anticariensis FP35 = DSM 16096]